MPIRCGRGIHDGGVRLYPGSSYCPAHGTGGDADARIAAYAFDLPSVREGVDIQDPMLFSKPDRGLDGRPIPFDTRQIEILLTRQGGQVWALHSHAFMRRPLVCCLVTGYQACGDCPCSNTRGHPWARAYDRRWSLTPVWSQIIGSLPSLRKLNTAVVEQRKMRIPRHFPGIAIEISEIARIPTPVGLLSRCEEGCTSRLGFG